MAEKKQLPPSPRKGSEGRDESPPQPPPRSSNPRPPMARQLEEFVGSLAVMAMPLDTYASEVIAYRSRELADAWARLAQKNPTVKKVLQGLLEGGAWGEVVMVSLSVAIPIAWNRGLVRDDIAMPFVMTGPVPPSPDVQQHEQAAPPAEPPAEPPAAEDVEPSPATPQGPPPPSGAAMSVPPEDASPDSD